MGVWVLLGVAFLFVAVLAIMFRFSHQAVEKESLGKAKQTLSGTVLNIENVIHEVQVATENMKWNVENHLDDPAAMQTYCLELVKNNPKVIACAIAMEPNFFLPQGREGLFMVYTYRTEPGSNEIMLTYDPTTKEPNVYGDVPYVGANWYFIPMRANETCWVRPHIPEDKFLSSIITCSTPIHDKTGKPVGVMATDISVNDMSRTVLGTKPYPNSYGCMLGVQGTYLIHPDSTRISQRLVGDIVKEEEDDRLDSLVASMLRGESGCRAVTLQGEDCYVLYEPLNAGHWSACIVCPESDIFSGNERLKVYMITITLIGLLLILMFCLLFVTQQMAPLGMLARSAQRIARKNFSEQIPPTTRKDEIGHLQGSFRTMQQALEKNLREMTEVSDGLKKRNDELGLAYEHVREADRVRMNLVHRIADKMIPPVVAIDGVVTNLQKSPSLKQEVVQPLSQQLMAQIKTLTKLLDQLLTIPQNKDK